MKITCYAELTQKRDGFRFRLFNCSRGIFDQILKKFKDTIPDSAREFDPITNSWLVRDDQILAIEDFCNQNHVAASWT